MKGISRSVSVVIGYLMSEKNMSYEEAIEYVKKKRPISDPNDGFVVQLKKFKEEIDLNKKEKKENKRENESILKEFQKNVLQLEPLRFSAVQY